jgi:hypothetical protein
MSDHAKKLYAVRSYLGLYPTNNTPDVDAAIEQLLREGHSVWSIVDRMRRMMRLSEGKQ